MQFEQFLVIVEVGKLLFHVDGGGLLVNVKRQFHILVVELLLFHVDRVSVDAFVLLLHAFLVRVLFMLTLQTLLPCDSLPPSKTPPLLFQSQFCRILTGG